jgi:hypothetical protein
VPATTFVADGAAGVLGDGEWVGRGAAVGLGVGAGPRTTTSVEVADPFQRTVDGTNVPVSVSFEPIDAVTVVSKLREAAVPRSICCSTEGAIHVTPDGLRFVGAASPAGSTISRSPSPTGPRFDFNDATTCSVSPGRGYAGAVVIVIFTVGP